VVRINISFWGIIHQGSVGKKGGLTEGRQTRVVERAGRVGDLTAEKKVGMLRTLNAAKALGTKGTGWFQDEEEVSVLRTSQSETIVHERGASAHSTGYDQLIVKKKESWAWSRKGGGLEIDLRERLLFPCEDLTLGNGSIHSGYCKSRGRKERKTSPKTEGRRRCTPFI